MHNIRRAQFIHHPRASTPLGPISLLPTEVLANIFLSCVSDESLANNHDIRTVPQLILTQVCSSWRKVCLSIPQLWSTLNLNLTTTTPKLPRASPFSSSSPSPSSSYPLTRLTQARANLASLWFERAKNQLLSVSVKLKAPYTNNSSDVSSVCVPILSNARSIQHLSIDVTYASQLRDFFTSPGADFINLASLSLSIHHVDVTPPITVFYNSPRLARVSFKLNDCPPSTSLLHLPWANIQHFEMAGASFLPADSFQSLLASCPNIRKASFWVEDALPSTTHSSPSPTLITLPNLTHLSISFYGRQEKTASFLLTPFSLPHLRHFHFFSGFITLPFLPAVTVTVTSPTPHPHLQSLVASGINISVADFSTFASRNPSLRSLTLDLRYFTRHDVSSILDVLATERPRVLPVLSNLSLWTQDISPHSTAYLRMIQSRGKKRNSMSSTSEMNKARSLYFSLYLARQQHGACCHFSTCGNSTNRNTSLNEILTLADACEKTNGGVIFNVKDVNPGDGIKETA